MSSGHRRGASAKFDQALAVISLASGAAALVLSAIIDAKARASSNGIEPAGDRLLIVAVWASSALVGTTLLLRRPGHRVGRLFAALGAALALWGLSESYANYGAVRPTAPFGTAAAATVANSVFIVVLMLVALVCSLTPDDRFLSARWRTASFGLVIAGSAWTCLRLVSPNEMEEQYSSTRNPWALRTVDLGSVRLVLAILTMSLVFASVVSLPVRFKRATGDVRRQLWWMVVAALPIPLLLVVAFVAALTGHDLLVAIATVVSILLVPIGAGVAILRFHLYDVERVLSRAISYVAVSGLVVATYASVVILAASAVGNSADRSPVATTVATLAALVIARPAYETLRNRLDRRFQRRRYDAVRTVRAFVADPPPDRRVDAVLQLALDDPGLRVAYWHEAGERWVTESGREADVGADAVRVRRAQRVVAAVTTACQDVEMIEAVLDEAAPELENALLRAAVAVQLEEVRASRERIAQAHIHERRRIERDLHDGVQQRLLGAAAQLRAALLNGSPDRLRAAVELGASEAQVAVAELRALANGLHPSVLDDGGLASALEDLASRLPIAIEFVGSPSRHLPVIEATMWFVACEAITNATKHADADRITVRLDDSTDHVRLVVADNGCGGAELTGSGLRGIADRVEAAGGSFSMSSPKGGGTRVEAVVPCVS